MTEVDEAQSSECPFRPAGIVDTEFAGVSDFAAIYNVAPIVPGHSLVIPRRHVQSIYELSDQECFEFVMFARRVTRLLVEAFSSDAFDWTLQDGEAAGQTVPHLHLHVIPRWRGDLAEPGDWYPMLQEQRRAARRNPGEYIDSASRPSLDAHARDQIVDHLRLLAAKDHLA